MLVFDLKTRKMCTSTSTSRRWQTYFFAAKKLLFLFLGHLFQYARFITMVLQKFFFVVCPHNSPEEENLMKLLTKKKVFQFFQLLTDWSLKKQIVASTFKNILISITSFLDQLLIKK